MITHYRLLVEYFAFASKVCMHAYVWLVSVLGPDMNMPIGTRLIAHLVCYEFAIAGQHIVAVYSKR